MLLNIPLADGSHSSNDANRNRPASPSSDTQRIQREIWTRWTYSDRAQAVIRILNQMAKQYQTAIIVVTHDEKIIPTFQRLYNIRDGRTFEEAGEGRALN